MTDISRSPDRRKIDRYLKHKEEEGLTPENNDNVRAMTEFYETWAEEVLEKESDPEWQKHNMEYDLRSSPMMVANVRNSNVYAQNLYAAMCNRSFRKNDIWPQLKGETWSCSWRYAGGIIADMRGEGDYIDWYCSGIRGDGLTDEEYNQLSKKDQEAYIETKMYVGESHVTDQIRNDLLTIGWCVLDNNEE